MNKCIHGLIPQTCCFCKSLPIHQTTNSMKSPAGNQIKNDQINQFPGEKLKTLIPGVDQNNHKKEEKGMEEKKNKVCIICGNPVKAKKLCNAHYTAWFTGKIDHPEIGKYVKPVKNKKNTEADFIPIDEEKPIIFGIEYGQLFTELRKRFREIEALKIALEIMGQGEQVKKEITLFSQRFV